MQWLMVFAYELKKAVALQGAPIVFLLIHLATCLTFALALALPQLAAQAD